MVFAEEMGARLTIAARSPPGHDIDMFDPCCEHLLVRALGVKDEPGPVIGAYRVLMPVSARRLGGFYSDTEFDLTLLRPLRSKRNRLDTMVGCASAAMRDGGYFAASPGHRLRQTYLAPIEWRVEPRLALPAADRRHDLAVDAPALIKGYRSCRAKVLGGPAWDAHFNTANLPMLLRIDVLPALYRRHFQRA